ncbi:MAG: PHP domain-containing protein, partial [Thiotrichaceae bacterium]|nr:PHP domain-containing protein [Thiotrichaceae bacterium]
MPTQFVHLHVHSEFSLVDSTVRLKPLIGQVVERGMGAIALTDMSNLFALVKMFKIATAAGVKPIFGADVWIRFEDRPQNLSKLVLLCQNDVGYLNLKRLISRSYQEGQTADRPTIFIDWLEGCTEGLLCLSSGLEGDVGQAIQAQNIAFAEQ